MTIDHDLEPWLGFDTCVVSDALDALGLPSGIIGLEPRTTTGQRVLGRALTIEVSRRTDDRPAPHLATAALRLAGPGDVLVIASGGITDVSSWGGILARAAVARGVVGVVVDGAFRDVDEIRDLGLSVHARAAVPVTARGRLVERSHGQPVTVGGVEVATGDLVVADGSGVVVVPWAHETDVLAEATRLAAREAEIGRALDEGAQLVDLMHDRSFEPEAST